MSGRLLLDTNVVIAIFAGASAVLAHLAETTEVFVPAIVLGELHYGARKSLRAEEKVAKIDEFASESAVIECDGESARHYGIIKNRLRAKGRPIPENDIWIAVIAVQHGLDMVSRDPHFEEIEDLHILAW